MIPVRQIQIEERIGHMDGAPVVVQIPIVPADATGELREGIQRRRDAALTGRCVCGAFRARPSRRDRRRSVKTGAFLHTPFEHRRSCPAHDDRLGPLIHAWSRGK